VYVIDLKPGPKPNLTPYSTWHVNVYRVSEAVWRLTRGLMRGGLYDPATGNSLFSPISILATLNMLLVGTTGNTREEILTTLGRP
jgi:hypothetical protein